MTKIFDSKLLNINDAIVLALMFKQEVNESGYSRALLILSYEIKFDLNFSYTKAGVAHAVLLCSDM